MAESASLYGSQSFFGWMDYDERDAQRMREVFAAFDDRGTIDSLGMGGIRDSFSDQLFPGTSTIQTRARYFFFVPWICQILEREQVRPAAFGPRLRELEVALIESLRSEHGPGEGVIGYRARKRLSRLPSSVYWNGLYAYGLRLLPFSLQDYRTALPRLSTAQEAVQRDDDGEVLTAVRPMWDPDLPAPPAGFPHEPISLELDSEERGYLTGRIMASQPDTMIGELVRDQHVDREVPYPWEVEMPDASPRLLEVLEHSGRFALLMEGAQALYNLLLARRAEADLDRDTSELQEDMLDEIAQWAEAVADRRTELQDWIEGTDFWPTVEQHTVVPGRTRSFVRSWAGIALAQPYLDIASSDAAERLIVEREFQLKAPLARLSNPRALETWNGESFAVGQTYRWGNARRILDDIQFHEAV